MFLRELYRHVETREEKCFHVSSGQIGHNNGPLRSDGFYHCCAVVLDFGSSGAFLAHAYPETEDSEEYTCIVNVARRLAMKARRMGFAMAESKAFVSAYKEEYRDRIIEDLREVGIPVIESSIEPYGRNVIYNPKEGQLRIEAI